MRRRFLRPGSRVLAAAMALTVAGCAGRSYLESELFPDAGSDAGQEVDAGVPPVEKSSKVDILFVVDNSPNTEAVHELLGASVSYFVDRLVRPACVNGLGNVVSTTALPTDPCPVGERDFAPIEDIHLAVISTSLGGHGADICSPSSTSWNPEQNDAAHLLSRGPGSSVVPTYAGQGFLAWDPQQKASPPGESNPNALASRLADMVSGVGAQGCGFESQLESMYRFLVDPEPYATIPIVNGKATPSGVDSLLLQQRKDFLRDDSALLVVLVTDENDCSTREGGQYYFANQGGDPASPNQPFHLPRARSACEKSPNDPCCASCGQETPLGCVPATADPACQLPSFTNTEDPINLRCFDQKRRFGIEFTYPIERYTRGLTEETIPNRAGDMVANPLFAAHRSPKLVMMTGVVGVPWQDIALEAKALATGIKRSAELDWTMLLGDPATGAPPTDPLMIESIQPRTGVNPPTGSALAPPASGPMANLINGHERDIPTQDDLQYACIYPRTKPVSCTSATCECNPPGTNPICQSADGTYSTNEGFARALPSTRPLRLLQSLGEQATVASICAATVSPVLPAFGYKPAIDATLRMLRTRLE